MSLLLARLRIQLTQKFWPAPLSMGSRAPQGWSRAFWGGAGLPNAGSPNQQPGSTLGMPGSTPGEPGSTPSAPRLPRWGAAAPGWGAAGSTPGSRGSTPAPGEPAAPQGGEPGSCRAPPRSRGAAAPLRAPRGNLGAGHVAGDWLCTTTPHQGLIR